MLAQFSSLAQKDYTNVSELLWDRRNTEQTLGVTRQDSSWPDPPQYLLIQLVKPLRAELQILNAPSQTVQTRRIPWPTHLAT